MKILILRNNVTDINKLNQGIAVIKQWMSGLPLVLDFIQVDTTKQFSSVQTHPSGVSVEGWVVNTSEIFQEGKRLGPADIYLLYYDRTKIFPTPITPVDNGMAMGLPTDYSPEVFAEFFLHELCHYYFGATGREDITHTYPLTPPLSQLPRKDWYIYLLKGLIAPAQPTIPTVSLVRAYHDNNQQLGDLFVGSFKAKTLERPWVNNYKNISCIPIGTYQVVWSFSPRLLRYTYEIINVPNRSGIRIHPGNFFFSIDGCILLGDSYGDLNHDSSADILNSTVTLKKFEDFMGRKPFILNIK